MKTKLIFTAIAFAMVITSCKKDKVMPPPPLAAKMNNGELKLSNVKMQTGVQGNNPNYELLKIAGDIDGDPAKHLIVEVAYKDIPAGQVIDLSTDNGKVFISYIPSPSIYFNAGSGSGKGGQLTITKNDIAGKKIEGRFSATLSDLFSQTISCTDGSFSVTY